MIPSSSDVKSAALPIDVVPPPTVGAPTAGQPSFEAALQKASQAPPPPPSSPPPAPKSPSAPKALPTSEAKPEKNDTKEPEKSEHHATKDKQPSTNESPDVSADAREAVELEREQSRLEKKAKAKVAAAEAVATAVVAQTEVKLTKVDESEVTPEPTVAPTDNVIAALTKPDGQTNDPQAKAEQAILSAVEALPKAAIIEEAKPSVTAVTAEQPVLAAVATKLSLPPQQPVPEGVPETKEATTPAPSKVLLPEGKPRATATPGVSTARLTEAKAAEGASESKSATKGENASQGENASRAVAPIVSAVEAVATSTPTPPVSTDLSLSTDKKAATDSGAVTATDPNSNSSTPPVTPPTGVAKLAWQVGPKTHTVHDSHGVSEVDRVRFVQRVARAFQSANDEGGTVRLRLSPPELGSLKVEIRIEAGQMSAKVEAETSQARTLLLDNLPALRERLEQQDIKLTRFDVELSNGGAGNLSQGTGQDPSTNQTGQRVQARRGGSNAEGSTSTTTAQRPTFNGDGHLNILI